MRKSLAKIKDFNNNEGLVAQQLSLSPPTWETVRVQVSVEALPYKLYTLTTNTSCLY